MVYAQCQWGICVRTAPLDNGSLTEDTAIWRHTVDLELEDTTVLED
jgi:hypothetical protein